MQRRHPSGLASNITRALAVVFVLPLVVAACGGSGDQKSAAGTPAASTSSGADLTGAGATFPYPIYSKWFADYAAKTGVKINYQSIGSGGGIRQLTEGTVDFGASDAPMTDAELAKAKGPILHFPTVLGAVVITYNLSGLSAPLKLNGDALAQIFAGKITKWNDSRIASLNAADLQSQLAATSAGQQLLQLTGNPTCGVDFYYVEFWTVDAQNSATESSGALMVPTGAGATCSGPRPIVLYAHGTNPDKTLNIADITNTSNTEGGLIAAMFAAQGYIVVAPNYAGYDISTLGYHPFLNATQQSAEMMDILAAARAGLPNTLAAATSDSGTLFLTGYSEGGFVAMATLRAMQAADQKVTGAAPMSGPYALEALGDAVFYGQVKLTVVQSAPPAYIIANTSHTFTISYANTGIYPTLAYLKETLPPNTIFNPALNPGWVAQGNGIYIYNLGLLAPGAKGTVHFTVTAGNVISFVNITNLVGISSDPGTPAEVATSSVKTKVESTAFLRWGR